MAVETITKRNPLALRRWQQGIGILVSLACLVAAVWGIDFSKTIEYFQSANSVTLAVAFLSVVITLLAKSLRWRILLRSEKPVGWWRCFTVLNIGILLNTLFPARLGDLARAFILAESERERKVYLIGTIAIEKIWDGAALLITAFCLTWVVILPDWLIEPLQLVAIIGLLGLLFLAILYWQWKNKRIRFSEIFQWGRIGRWVSIQARAVADTLIRLRQERVLFGFTLWTLLIIILGASTNYLVFLAFDLRLSFLPALFLLVVLMAGVSVPSVPGRFGVFHYLTVISLALFGISKDLALVCGIVLHLITYIPTVLVGSYGLLRERTPWQWTVRAFEGKRETNETPE
jgi:uncharacterized protein (TIRG00374 family)